MQKLNFKKRKKGKKMFVKNKFKMFPGDGSESDGFGVFSINLPHQVKLRF